MYLAIFGDVHGNLDSMYDYVERWEQKHGKISAILQVGDLGVFLPGGPFDKATRLYARKDPTELGCIEYVVGQKEATHLTVFVRGNHEDFDFLFKNGNTYIDPYKKIRHLKSGELFTFNEEQKVISVCGLGGIFCPVEKRGNPDISRKYFTDQEIESLLYLEGYDLDILLFHEAPKGMGDHGHPLTGSEEITLIIERLQPYFAFYGHYKYPPEPTYIGRTLCVCMNSPNAMKLPRRKAGMGIVNTDDWTFSFVREGDL